jgi:hypothetical protein
MGVGTAQAVLQRFWHLLCEDCASCDGNLDPFKGDPSSGGVLRVLDALMLAQK